MSNLTKLISLLATLVAVWTPLVHIGFDWYDRRSHQVCRCGERPALTEAGKR